MEHKNSKKLAVLLICLTILVTIPIVGSSTIDVYYTSKESSNKNEQGLMFLWLAGHLKDVKI